MKDTLKVPFTESYKTIEKGSTEKSSIPLSDPFGSSTRVYTTEQLSRMNFTDQNAVKVLQSLENKLSPENLLCDGGISYTQVMKKRAKLMKLWDALEDYLGMKVDPIC